jgi:hypothetical protein
VTKAVRNVRSSPVAYVRLPTYISDDQKANHLIIRLGAYLISCIVGSSILGMVVDLRIRDWVLE